MDLKQKLSKYQVNEMKIEGKFISYNRERDGGGINEQNLHFAQQYLPEFRETNEDT